MAIKITTAIPIKAAVPIPDCSPSTSLETVEMVVSFLVYVLVTDGSDGTI